MSGAKDGSQTRRGARGWCGPCTIYACRARWRRLWRPISCRNGAGAGPAGHDDPGRVWAGGHGVADGRSRGHDQLRLRGAAADAGRLRSLPAMRRRGSRRAGVTRPGDRGRPHKGGSDSRPVATAATKRHWEDRHECRSHRHGRSVRGASLRAAGSCARLEHQDRAQRIDRIPRRGPRPAPRRAKENP